GHGRPARRRSGGQLLRPARDFRPAGGRQPGGRHRRRAVRLGGAGADQPVTSQITSAYPARPQSCGRAGRVILGAVDLSPFRIERFYARYEHSTRYMLSSSDCESRTVGDLLELEPGAHERLLETWCGYTEPLGDPGLRQAIAALYERAGADEVVVTSC